jgi:ABC-type glutathione transport system ATPase component
MKNSTPLLSVCLTVDYRARQGVLRDAFLQINRGEVLGLLGQSGSGKSTIALGVLRLLDSKKAKVSGTIHFSGTDLMKLSEREMRHIRGSRIALVLQSPLSALNPAMKIGHQLSEAWRAHAAGAVEACSEAVRDAMCSVALPSDPTFLNRYPSELSVGQAQRVLIAMAVIHNPALLIADEPTSALDVITQAQILRLFRRLNREKGIAILYISHDLGSVASICDRIAILHGGEIVECASTTEVLTRPVHPYTKQLTAAQATTTSRSVQPEVDLFRRYSDAHWSDSSQTRAINSMVNSKKKILGQFWNNSLFDCRTKRA